MSHYDFNKVIDRNGTDCCKFDGLLNVFGKNTLTPLWIADMDFEVCPEITNALIERIKHPIYGYSNPCDCYWQSIIDWLGRIHNFKVTREELTYIPGVVKGVGFAVNCLSEKGDKIVIQPPVYHPFKKVVEGSERVVVENPLVEKDGFYEMDFEGLENIFKNESPKMMILCNPHNPIGIPWEKEVLAKVAELAYKYHVIVISDEIHGDLAVFGNKHTPFATASEEAAQVSVTLGAPSKTFNIPGVVSSWTVVKNPEIRSKFFGWLEANEFNAPTFMATIATKVAYTEGEQWHNEVMKYIEENVIALDEYIQKNIPGVKIMRPKASFLVWLDCRGLNLSHDQLIDLFVNKAELALNDGAMFGKEGTGFMRLNVATQRATLLGAMEKLAKVVKTL